MTSSILNQQAFVSHKTSQLNLILELSVLPSIVLSAVMSRQPNDIKY